jgi:hypothetical protein
VILTSLFGFVSTLGELILKMVISHVKLVFSCGLISVTKDEKGHNQLHYISTCVAVYIVC